MAEVHKLADAAVPISVILPVLNDEPQLCHTLEQAASVLAASGLTYEIIVVAADLQHAAVPDAAGLSSVQLVTQEHGSGWGDAILTASAQAQHDLICTIDLHTLYAVAEIPRLLRALEEHDAAMVVGVRIGVQKPISARRRILPWILDMLASDALGRPILDLNSGLRLLRRTTLHEFADRLSVPSALPAMLTLLMTAADAPVLYLPLDDEPRTRSFGLRTARETFRLIGLIISVGLEHAPRRTIILIGRMALMMLMMVAMGIMMMWMMGMLPGI